MAKKNNAKSAGGGNAAAKTEKKGKNQISQQQARANAARASAKISPAPEGPAPAISVLVPICNSEQYLEQALDSLIAQTHCVSTTAAPMVHWISSSATWKKTSVFV